MINRPIVGIFYFQVFFVRIIVKKGFFFILVLKLLNFFVHLFNIIFFIAEGNFS